MCVTGHQESDKNGRHSLLKNALILRISMSLECWQFPCCPPMDSRLRIPDVARSTVGWANDRCSIIVYRCVTLAVFFFSTDCPDLLNCLCGHCVSYHSCSCSVSQQGHTLQCPSDSDSDSSHHQPCGHPHPGWDLRCRGQVAHQNRYCATTSPVGPGFPEWGQFNVGNTFGGNGPTWEKE